MASRGSLILLLAILFNGCRPATPPPPAVDQTQTASSPVTEATSIQVGEIPDEALQIRNAQYQLGATDTLQIVELSEGKFEQGTPGSDNFMSVSLTDFAAVGDLTGDGTDEVAALISENFGGTGVFVFLTIFSNVDGTWTYQTSTMVDDRPELRALSIANNEVYVDAVIHGMEDAMCCPSLRTTRRYRFVDSQLDMIDYTTFTPDGQPRIITIESPVNGAEVFTSVPIKGKVTIAPFENNLVYRIFDVSGIELSAGPLAVTAPDLGAAGTFEAVIPLGKLLSGAIIRLEVQDLSAADSSLLAMDSVELVVK